MFRITHIGISGNWAEYEDFFFFFFNSEHLIDFHTATNLVT